MIRINNYILIVIKYFESANDFEVYNKKVIKKMKKLKILIKFIEDRLMNNKSIVKNFIMNSILNISSFIFPLITFPYVSRVLSPSGMGKVTFISSIVAYLLIIAQLGIPTYGVKMCAKVRDDREKLTKVTHELLIINIIMSIVSYIILIFIMILSLKIRSENKLLVIISSSIFFNTISVEWLYKGLEEYGYITKRSLFFKFVSVILMFIFVRNEMDYIIYGAITVVASAGSGVMNFINLRKYIDFKYIKRYNLKQHIKPIFIFFSMSVAITIYTNIDIVMLGFIKGDTEVGYYNAAVKIKMLLSSIIASLGTVLLPRASYYLNNGNRDSFFDITKKALNFVFIIGIPIVIFFICDAEQGIMLLSSEKYRLSIMPMKIIMPTVLIIGITNIMGIQMLVPLEKEKYVLKSTCYGAITNVLLNIILIPRYSSSGAAFATMIAELVVLWVMFINFKEMFLDIFKDIQYNKILISIIVPTIILLIVNKYIEKYFISLLVGGVFFFLIYIIILIILREKLVKDIIINKILSKKNKYI